jgi:hypothetical protein
MEYYHGTVCEFRVGDELTADGARASDAGYPAHIRYVWAASKPLVAAMHVIKHGRGYWDAGHVYVVEAVDAGDVEPDPLDQGGSSYRSAAGFRVVRRAGSPADLWG